MNVPSTHITKYFDVKLASLAKRAHQTREDMGSELRRLVHEAEGCFEQLADQALAANVNPALFPDAPYIGFITSAAEHIAKLAAQLDDAKEQAIRLHFMKDDLTHQFAFEPAAPTA